MKRFFAALVVTVFFMPMMFVEPALSAPWKSYVNDRFGTSAQVPARGFIAQPVPANNDGRIWKAADGRGSFAVYGSYMVVVDTFRQYRNFMLESARNDGVDITYNVAGNGWFVYSGYLGNDIIYAKVVLSRNCSQTVLNHIYLQYPRSEKLRYDPIVTRMAKTLTNVAWKWCN
ncbi:hypothetical protein MNBD_ALPHA12-1507 [hydrothermal vent metagenome]|uniref:Uncharacterized protein n=1 Tax=hydrothermal vent metagenome TaxID=652676 RepID=A0A3B0TU30_9ZZZZ